MPLPIQGLLAELQKYADWHLEKVRIRRYPCPTCLAKPGEPCRSEETYDRKPRYEQFYVHVEREIDAGKVLLDLEAHVAELQRQELEQCR